MRERRKGEKRDKEGRRRGKGKVRSKKKKKTKKTMKKPSNCYSEVVLLQPCCSWVANFF